MIIRKGRIGFKSKLSRLIHKSPGLYLIRQIFYILSVPGKVDLQEVHNSYVATRVNRPTKALDLGCGPDPKNKFNADEYFGIDLERNKSKNILQCRLGYEKIPFDDNTFDYITAYDIVEHIPRFSDSKKIYNPFIFFMNECYRVLKKDGIFLSVTPVYPFFGAFQDPTHTNIITIDTFRLYFSTDRLEITQDYGIDTEFRLLEQGMHGQHLVVVMSK